MNSTLRRIMDGVGRRVRGFDLRGTFRGITQSLRRIEDRQAHFEETLAALERHMEANRELTREQRDDVAGLRGHLAALRGSPRYQELWSETEPLISVRIAAWRKTEPLIDVAIASVLRQTYQRFEIVIVNDGPNAETADAIAKLGDPRIRYSEFPEQNRYPADPHLRWMVAGAPGMNRAVELSEGTWIAPLDDDDEFTPDHLEKLLAAALDQRAELAYGAITQNHVTRGEQYRIWSYPPAINHFTFMGALYLKSLDFFRYDQLSWIVQEPADWNLIRRMSAAGVRMTAIEDVVGTMHSVSYTAKQ